MLIEKIDRTVEFDIAFDILDAAIHRCLSNTVQGFVDFEREEPTHATIVYMLSQRQIGVFGKIRIDKLGTERTEISLFEFREPFTISEQRKKHYNNVIESLLNKLGQENIWPEKQDDNQSLKGDIAIGKNMIDSTIIKGDNNVINIAPRPTRKHK